MAALARGVAEPARGVAEARRGVLTLVRIIGMRDGSNNGDASRLDGQKDNLTRFDSLSIKKTLVDS